MKLLLNLYLFILMNNEKKYKTEIKKISTYWGMMQNQTGYDYRNIKEPKYDLYEYINKHEMLLKLQSDISVFEKLRIIEEINKCCYLPNIENGGLRDIWNDVF
jgi:hypothetical protein